MFSWHRHSLCTSGTKGIWTVWATRRGVTKLYQWHLKKAPKYTQNWSPRKIDEMGRSSRVDNLLVCAKLWVWSSGLQENRKIVVKCLRLLSGTPFHKNMGAISNSFCAARETLKIHASLALFDGSRGQICSSFLAVRNLLSASIPSMLRSFHV